MKYKCEALNNCLKRLNCPSTVSDIYVRETAKETIMNSILMLIESRKIEMVRSINTISNETGLDVTVVTKKKFTHINKQVRLITFYDFAELFRNSKEIFFQ